MYTHTHTHTVFICISAENIFSVYLFTYTKGVAAHILWNRSCIAIGCLKWCGSARMQYARPLAFTSTAYTFEYCAPDIMQQPTTDDDDVAIHRERNAILKAKLEVRCGWMAGWSEFNVESI